MTPLLPPAPIASRPCRLRVRFGRQQTAAAARSGPLSDPARVVRLRGAPTPSHFQRVAVPEPSTYAWMLGGASLLGLTLLRRTRWPSALP